MLSLNRQSDETLPHVAELVNLLRENLSEVLRHTSFMADVLLHGLKVVLAVPS